MNRLSFEHGYPSRYWPWIGLILLLPALALDRGQGHSPDAVNGTVFDSTQPLSRANVRWRGGSRFVRTNAAGHFLIPREPGRGRLTAWKHGFLIGGCPEGEANRIELKPLPDLDREDYAWVDPAPDANLPGNCGNCHQEIFGEWQRGGHARSSSSKHFLNLYDGSDADGRPDQGPSLLKEHPDGAGVCSACHAPTLKPSSVDEYDLRKGRDPRPFLNEIHCDFCHKVREASTAEFGLSHGRYALSLLRPRSGEQLFFGPLPDVDRGEDVYSPFQRDSRFCAACHEGVVFGVPVYTTYSEWLQSPARREGKSCQSCHMKPTGRMTTVTDGGFPRHPQTLGNHVFFNGSQAEMLRSALRLEVETAHTSSGIQVRLRLKAGDVGHRIPTGFIDRQLILAVEGGEPISGPRLPPEVGLRLSGKPGRLFARTLHDFEGRAGVPFWRGDPGGIVDTRLSPDATSVSDYHFPAGTRKLTIRVLYRRFAEPLAEIKRWDDTEIEVLVREVNLE